MKLIEWKDEFAIGIASVDAEHKDLITLINSLSNGLHAGAAHETVVETFGDLHALIASHFALEERVMQDRGYARFDEHKTDHELLLDQICDIADDYEDQRTVDRDELSSRLETWFSEHFRRHDARLHHELG